MKIQNLIHIVIGIVCIGLLSRAQAVGPPPDGGYPGFNTAEGQNALFSLTTGAGTLLANTGDNNIATGAGALLSNTTGAQNTASGAFALFHNTTGFQNIAIGDSALFFNQTGTGNIVLGVDSGGNVTTANNVICIGIGVPAENVDNSCYIGNIFETTSSGGSPVFVEGSGKLGTSTSSRRFKEEIKPMKSASEALFALNPVTFRYKNQIDPKATQQFGLVAEEVEKVNPDLVVRDKGGKPYSVRYDQVNAMLLNEFLKEHKTVEEQGATITQQRKDFEAALARQQKQIEALTTGLQKVNNR
jgi:Chaperone of endosialidase